MTCLFSVLSAQVTLSPRAVFANEQELCHLCHLGRWAWRGEQGGAPSSLLFSLQPALSGSPGFICWSRGFMELGVTGSRAELVDSLKEYSAHRGNPPLLLFPEEAATNGRAGLLRFRCGSGNSHSRGEGILTAGGRELSQQGGWEWLWCIVTRWLEVAPGSFTAEFLPSSSWPFSILDEVQPVALQVRRPLVAVVSGGHRDRLWGGYSFSFCSCFGACGVSWHPGTSCSGLTLFPVPFLGIWPVSLTDVWWPSWLSLCLWLPWPVQSAFLLVSSLLWKISCSQCLCQR